MTEAELQEAIRDAAKLGGWLYYHTHDSRRSPEGFPDLVLVHQRRRLLLFVELKSDTGTVTPPQLMWLDALTSVAEAVFAEDGHKLVEAVVWRPKDLDDAIDMLLDRWPYPRRVMKDNPQA